MNKNTGHLLLLGALLCIAAMPCAAAPANAAYSYYEAGNVTAKRPARTSPGLLLVGGGDWDESALRWFGERAGHGHIVVISASGGREPGDELYREIGGLASVETIEFHSRRAAFDRHVLSLLRHADGIFIAGGDQANYVRFWKDTPVARLLDEHLSAGKPLGGTSAGLAILGSAAYGAMDGGSLKSAQALADPAGPAVTIVRNFLHVPFLSHVITNSHFTARNRLGRLIAFVARVHSTTDPDAVGLGIDEGSALAVDPEGIGRLFTRTHGYAWLVELEGAAHLSPGKPLDGQAVRITGIGPSGSIDLRTLRVSNRAFYGVASVREGKLFYQVPTRQPEAHSSSLASPSGMRQCPSVDHGGKAMLPSHCRRSPNRPKWRT